MSVTIILTPLILGSLAAAAGGTSCLIGTLPIKIELPQEVREKQCFTRSTVMNDIKVLREAAESLGGIIINANLFCVNGVEFVIRQADIEQQHIEIYAWSNEFTEEQANDFISGIEAEYIRIVRDKTLANVSEHCKECGLELESEEVQEDQTVVLTFRV